MLSIPGSLTTVSLLFLSCGKGLPFIKKLKVYPALDDSRTVPEAPES